MSLWAWITVKSPRIYNSKYMRLILKCVKNVKINDLIYFFALCCILHYVQCRHREPRNLVLRHSVLLLFSTFSQILESLQTSLPEHENENIKNCSPLNRNLPYHGHICICTLVLLHHNSFTYSAISWIQEESGNHN